MYHAEAMSVLRIRRYAALCAGIISVLLRGRVLVLLLLVFLLLGPAMVVVRQSTGSIDRDPPLYLFYAPAVLPLAQYHAFLFMGGFPMMVPPALAAFYHSGHISSGLGLNGLDEVYRVLVALLMLLLGANVLPQNAAVYTSMFTAPVRKTTLYLLHAVVLLLVCFVLFGLAFLANTAAVRFVGGATTQDLRLLFNFHVLVALYGGVFASLGMAAAALFRQRALALLIGMAAVVLVIAVIPNVQSALELSYRETHDFELRLAGLTGVYPSDPLYRAIHALTLAPSVAYTYSMFYMRYDVMYPDSGLCPYCKPGETRWVLVNRARLSLAATSLGLLALGAVAFSRKEATST